MSSKAVDVLYPTASASAEGNNKPKSDEFSALEGKFLVSSGLKTGWPPHFLSAVTLMRLIQT